MKTLSLKNCFTLFTTLFGLFFVFAYPNYSLATILGGIAAVSFFVEPE